ncbi:MAG: aminotransferase class I/II-fold pyridoxal phosphate-dependent enzyme [Myxococcota bacterium]
MLPDIGGEGRRIHVVFDEIYGLSVFGKVPFTSVASRRPKLGELTHIVWAFSKDFGASGMRCGVMVSENEDLVQAVDQLAYWGACSGHSQRLLSALVADQPVVDDYVAGTQHDLKRTYARVTDALASAHIPYVDADAAFFLLCDFRPFLKTADREGERRLWRRLLEHAQLNLTPGEACRITEPGFFRLCYAGIDDATLDVALERLTSTLSS